MITSQPKREAGLILAIAGAGGISALARRLGLAQPSVSRWRRVPAERVVEVEAASGVPREFLRPDLYRGADPLPNGPLPRTNSHPAQDGREA